MSKALVYKLFRIGSIPAKVRPVLEAEGILAFDEGIRGSVFTRNFRAPGKRFKYRKAWFAGFLAVTRKRIIAYTWWKPVINIGVDDSRIAGLELELKNSEKLVIEFESSDFDPSMQGRIEVGFHTPEAEEFYRLIKSFQKV